jgi:glycerate 2-kinase
LRVVVAPDKFAGTLRAAEAAAAIEEGWRQARPDDEVVRVPMADGGEGTIDVVAEVTGAQRVTTEVVDARGHATDAVWLRLPDGRALVEAAQAVGLSRLPADLRDPLQATSYGVGQLLAEAAGSGATAVLVSLGGTATVDGGAGMATALGHRLLRGDGNGVKVGAMYLRDLDRVEPVSLPLPPVIAVSDVTNPLLGADGAAVVFGPQKGAAPDDVAELEALLSHFADVVERDVPGGPWRTMPGAGAAGGLGFALAAFCGARVVDGAATVGELAGLDLALDTADVVITGEGKLDGQTARGKAPGYVAERARAVGARVFAVAGAVVGGAGDAFDAVIDLGPEGMVRARELVVGRTAELARREVGVP